MLNANVDLTSLSPEVITAISVGATSLISGCVAVVLSRLKLRKTKNELAEVKERAELEKVKLEAEKLHLENQLICGTYTICPNCGSKLLLTDLVFHNDYAKEEKK